MNTKKFIYVLGLIMCVVCLTIIQKRYGLDAYILSLLVGIGTVMMTAASIK